MRKIQRIIFISVSVLSFISFSSIVSKAQEVPNYLFLEVVDSSEKPVADAAVEVPPFSNQTIKTNERGEAHSYLPNMSGDFTNSLFKVSKTGYFTFQDLGIPMRQYDQLRLKLKLLKIPQTSEERQAL